MSFSHITILLVVLTVVITVLGCNSDDNDTTDGGDTDNIDKVKCRTKADVACYAFNGDETGCQEATSCDYTSYSKCLDSNSCWFRIESREECEAGSNCQVGETVYSGCIPSCGNYKDDEAKCVADALCEFRAEDTWCYQKGDPACWDAGTQGDCEAMESCMWWDYYGEFICSHKTDACLGIEEEQECNSTDQCLWSDTLPTWYCYNDCDFLHESAAICTSNPECAVDEDER